MQSYVSATDSLLAIGHRTRLGALGEQLAIGCLEICNFKNFRNLNLVRFNNAFADVAAERDGVEYIISVKCRNKLTNKGALNRSYNCLKVNQGMDKKLKASGHTSSDVTRRLYDEISRIAQRENAVPAWVTVAIDTTTATYSAYFGLIGDLRGMRSVPMTPTACARYEALAVDFYDPRITPDLSNARSSISE